MNGSSSSLFSCFFLEHMKRGRSVNAEYHHSPTCWIYLLCISLVRVSALVKGVVYIRRTGHLFMVKLLKTRF